MGLLSIEFLIFYLLFFCCYWLLPNLKYGCQNLILLIGNYLFYFYLDRKFLVLLVFVSFVSYWTGYLMINSKENEKFRYAKFGIIINITILILFKYTNDIKTCIASFSNLTLPQSLSTFILPLGLSYYIFKNISYIIDVKNGHLNSEKNIINFFCFVSYFPCIIAGPIDRAKSFLPQIKSIRKFEYDIITNGIRQILWGLFKKLVIADNCSTITQSIFENYKIYPASSLLIAVILYSIEIYADFSGYSDIAIGISKTFGIDLDSNFKYPYFSKNIKDFWRRWHISLTKWITDYVYTPLVIYFRDFGKKGQILALFINFFLVGLWHGSKINYIIYGLIHCTYFIPFILKKRNKPRIKNSLFIKKIREYLSLLLTFILISLTFVIFKMHSLSESANFFYKLLSKSIFEKPVTINSATVLIIILFSIILFSIEWKSMKRNEEFGISNIQNYYNKKIRWGIYTFLIFSIGMYTGSLKSEFLYFKF